MHVWYPYLYRRPTVTSKATATFPHALSCHRAISHPPTHPPASPQQLHPADPPTCTTHGVLRTYLRVAQEDYGRKEGSGCAGVEGEVEGSGRGAGAGKGGGRGGGREVMEHDDVGEGRSGRELPGGERERQGGVGRGGGVKASRLVEEAVCGNIGSSSAPIQWQAASPTATVATNSLIGRPGLVADCAYW